MKSYERVREFRRRSDAEHRSWAARGKQMFFLKKNQKLLSSVERAGARKQCCYWASGAAQFRFFSAARLDVI
jgi:hypothetical protein